MTPVSKIRLAVTLFAASLAFNSQAAEITGAGSSFVYPVLSKWSGAYNEKTGNKVNYQSIGSGGGIAQIEAATVDFGASDKPLSAEDLRKYGLGQFPVVRDEARWCTAGRHLPRQDQQME